MVDYWRYQVSLPRQTVILIPTVSSIKVVSRYHDTNGIRSPNSLGVIPDTTHRPVKAIPTPSVSPCPTGACFEHWRRGRFLPLNAAGACPRCAAKPETRNNEKDRQEHHQPQNIRGSNPSLASFPLTHPQSPWPQGQRQVAAVAAVAGEAQRGGSMTLDTDYHTGVWRTTPAEPCATSTAQGQTDVGIR